MNRPTVGYYDYGHGERRKLPNIVDLMPNGVNQHFGLLLISYFVSDQIEIKVSKSRFVKTLTLLFCSLFYEDAMFVVRRIGLPLVAASLEIEIHVYRLTVL